MEVQGGVAADSRDDRTEHSMWGNY